MIWADPNNSNLDSLFLLQKRVIRTCTNSLWLDHTDPLFSSLSTLKVRDIYKLQLASFMYQFHHNLLPFDFLKNNVFKTDTLSHHYDTRHVNDTFIITTNTVLASNTSTTQGPLLWNQLPDHLKTTSSLCSFKSNLKQFFISSYISPASL